MGNVKSWFAETFSGALGHGAAVTYPDRPYLVWKFKYEDPEQWSPLRNNPETFLQGAHALHEFFSKLAKANPDFYTGKQMKFSAIESTVKDIIDKPGKKPQRVKTWQAAAGQGALFPTGKESIPAYSADIWLNQRANLQRRKNSAEARNTGIFRFYQAASVHRVHLIRHLLPSHGLVVS